MYYIAHSLTKYFWYLPSILANVQYRDPRRVFLLFPIIHTGSGSWVTLADFVSTESIMSIMRVKLCKEYVYITPVSVVILSNSKRYYHPTTFHSSYEPDCTKMIIVNNMVIYMETLPVIFICGKLLNPGSSLNSINSVLILSSWRICWPIIVATFLAHAKCRYNVKGNSKGEILAEALVTSAVKVTTKNNRRRKKEGKFSTWWNEEKNNANLQHRI